MLLLPVLTPLVLVLSALAYIGIERPALAHGRRYRISGWLSERLRGDRERIEVHPLSGPRATTEFRT